MRTVNVETTSADTFTWVDLADDGVARVRPQYPDILLVPAILFGSSLGGVVGWLLCR